ncbi:MAG: hypothetical protein IJO33_01415 [Bacilli bacterium]|nr:hypothetical protein [Bacilli bacterium]
MEKKSGNTIMLTVIAIATLLVAVVGATFAYFSANTTGNAGKTTVEVNTAAAADTFLTEGNSVVTLDVTADKMQQADGNNDYSVKITNDVESTIDVKLTAGSSKATCTYDLTYTPSAAFNASAKAAEASLKEFTLVGTSTDGNEFEEKDLAGVTDAIVLGSYSISDEYADALVESVDTWTFTANFYNLAVDQNDNINKTFGGVVSVTNVKCTNAAN